MWLLETESVETYPRLKSIPEQDLEPPEEDEKAAPRCSYTILSHRWEADDEEISFDDIGSGRPVHGKKGWYKMRQSCRQARADGYQYVWIDSCCIDKRSSAELQEAINSMYHWYERAVVCYVYLRDVSASNAEREFSKSEWFNRGWTLQELLAPANIIFFDRTWNSLGSKISLEERIAEITSIDADVLSGSTRLEHCSVATRMSWASRRRTTRIEDRAYSLLGIFGINMPMLYGERDKAFLRLQEEIVRRNTDHSIFAWSHSQFFGAETWVRRRGLFAINPDDFRDSGDIVRWGGPLDGESYSLTNKGLSISLDTMPYCLDVYLAYLDCSRAGSRVGIFLRLLPNAKDRSSQVYQAERVAVGERDLGSELPYPYAKRRTLLIPQTEGLRRYQVSSIYGFRLSPRMLPMDSRGRPLFFVAGGHWNADKRIITIPYHSMPLSFGVIPVGFLILTDQRSQMKIFAFAFKDNFDPLVFVSETYDLSAVLDFNNPNLPNLQRQAWDRILWSDLAIDLWAGLRNGTQFSAPQDSRMWVMSAGQGRCGNYVRDKRYQNGRVGHVEVVRHNVNADGRECLCWNVHIDFDLDS